MKVASYYTTGYENQKPLQSGNVIWSSVNGLLHGLCCRWDNLEMMDEPLNYAMSKLQQAIETSQCRCAISG